MFCWKHCKNCVFSGTQLLCITDRKAPLRPLPKTPFLQPKVPFWVSPCACWNPNFCSVWWFLCMVTKKDTFPRTDSVKEMRISYLLNTNSVCQFYKKHFRKERNLLPTHCAFEITPPPPKHYKIGKKTSKTNLGQIFDSTLDRFLTQERPTIGQIVDSTAYIHTYIHTYIYIYIFFFIYFFFGGGGYQGGSLGGHTKLFLLGNIPIFKPFENVDRQNIKDLEATDRPNIENLVQALLWQIFPNFCYGLFFFFLFLSLPWCMSTRAQFMDVHCCQWGLARQWLRGALAGLEVVQADQLWVMEGHLLTAGSLIILPKAHDLQQPSTKDTLGLKAILFYHRCSLETLLACYKICFRPPARTRNKDRKRPPPRK